VDPRTLDTLSTQPELLDGFLIDGIAPSTTGSDFLDQVRPVMGLSLLGSTIFFW
jgi:hypothetical protein